MGRDTVDRLGSIDAASCAAYVYDGTANLANYCYELRVGRGLQYLKQ